MLLRDAISVSLDNLKQARLRTALTTLGVTIGVGCIVVMLSIAAGLQQNIYDKLLKFGFFRRITVFAQPARAQQAPRPLDDAALTSIRQIPGVTRITQEIRLPVKIEANGKTVNSSLGGLTTDDADEAVFTEMKYGHFITSEKAPEIILNTTVARNLGYATPADAVGKTLRVSVNFPSARGGFGFAMPESMPQPPPLELKVIGVIERERALFADSSPPLPVPYEIIQQQADFFRKEVPLLAAMTAGLTPIQVRVGDPRDVERIEREIKGLGFRTISIASIISNMRRAFIVLDMLLGLIGGVALVVASLGIINTMVMAVLERTREIGVMKAVGAEDSDIRRIFLTESAIIGVLGGGFGLLLAWALGRIMNYGANIYIQREGFRPENLFQIPLWLIAAAIGFSMVISVASGLYPAGRAARIDPARALRHD